MCSTSLRNSMCPLRTTSSRQHSNNSNNSSSGGRNIAQRCMSSCVGTRRSKLNKLRGWVRTHAFIEETGLTECCNLSSLTSVLLRHNFAMRTFLVSHITMLNMQCLATLEEVFHGAEHGVILRLLYRHICMVLPDYFDASRLLFSCYKR